MATQDKDFSLTAVPSNKRVGFLRMFAVMVSLTFFSASMWAGGALGEGLSFRDLLFAIFVGNGLLGAFTGALAYIAARTGLSTHLLAQYSFGRKGAYINSFMLSATQVGWFGVGLAMLAYPVHLVTGIPVPIILVVSGILMISTAYIGMKALAILGGIAVPAIGILGSTSVGIAVNDMGGVGPLFAHSPEASAVLPISAALTITIGSFISAGTLTPDFARFAKNSKQAVSTTVIAFLLGNSLMFLFGAIGVIATGHNDISNVMLSQGLIIPAVIVLGLNIWTTNDNALYASGLGLATIFKKPKTVMVLINGVVGILLSTTLYAHFTSWLTLLGSILPAIGAVIITDYFFIQKRNYVPFEEADIKDFHIPAIIAWAAGIVAGVALPGIAPLNSLFATGIVYFVSVKIAKSKSAKEKIEESELHAKVG